MLRHKIKYIYNIWWILHNSYLCPFIAVRQLHSRTKSYQKLSLSLYFSIILTVTGTKQTLLFCIFQQRDLTIPCAQGVPSAQGMCCVWQEFTLRVHQSVAHGFCDVNCGDKILTMINKIQPFLVTYQIIHFFPQYILY